MSQHETAVFLYAFWSFVISGVLTWLLPDIDEVVVGGDVDGTFS